ncbi:X-box binding protein 1, partial [Chelydra serpentina]
VRSVERWQRQGSQQPRVCHGGAARVRGPAAAPPPRPSSRVPGRRRRPAPLPGAPGGGAALPSPEPQQPARKRQRLTHLSPEEKALRRKLKNRVAAQSARDRKKARMSELEQQVLELEQEVRLGPAGCSGARPQGVPR